MAARVAIRLIPRAGIDRIDGIAASHELLVRVRAIPADGAANEALRRLVAHDLGLSVGEVVIEAGQRSRTKRLRVEGLSGAELRRVWPGVAAVDAPDRAVG